MRPSCVVLLTCLLAGCSTQIGAGSLDDASQWQGTWKMVSATYEGEPQPGDVQWVVNGDHYNIRLNQQLQEDPYNFKLDASRKRIDVFHHETPAGTYGGGLKGIYKISGDSLTVCYDLTGRQYPTSFDASRGSWRVVYRFQRALP